MCSRSEASNIAHVVSPHPLKLRDNKESVTVFELSVLIIISSYIFLLQESMWIFYLIFFASRVYVNLDCTIWTLLKHFLFVYHRKFLKNNFERVVFTPFIRKKLFLFIFSILFSPSWVWRGHLWPAICLSSTWEYTCLMSSPYTWIYFMEHFSNVLN